MRFHQSYAVRLLQSLVVLISIPATCSAQTLAVIEPASKLATLVALVVVLIVFSRRGRRIVQEQREAIMPTFAGLRRIDRRVASLKPQVSKNSTTRPLPSTRDSSRVERPNIRIHSNELEEIR